MAWHNDIENLIHQHVKPYDKAAPLAHAVTAIAWDVVNRQTGQLNRLDEVIDEATTRAEAAEAEVAWLRSDNDQAQDLIVLLNNELVSTRAEVARLREALGAMAERYLQGNGNWGGCGVGIEIRALLNYNRQ